MEDFGMFWIWMYEIIMTEFCIEKARLKSQIGKNIDFFHIR
jgi:hypothetical protein